MERWLIDKYGLSVDLSICIVFHFWKKEYIYGFQGQDKDFWSYKQATIWQKWSKKINPATLKKKKGWLLDHNFGFVQLQKQKNLPTRTVVSESGSCLNYATIALCNSTLTYTQRQHHTVAATSLHLTAFCIKMARNRQREKKQSRRRNKFRSSDLAKWKRKCASACHDSILCRLWWGGAQPDPCFLDQRKHNFIASLLWRPDAERRDNVYYFSEWKSTIFLPNTQAIITEIRLCEIIQETHHGKFQFSLAVKSWHPIKSC